MLFDRFTSLNLQSSYPGRDLKVSAFGTGKHQILLPACDDGSRAATLWATKRQLLHREKYALERAQRTGADEQSIEEQCNELKWGIFRQEPGHRNRKKAKKRDHTEPVPGAQLEELHILFRPTLPLSLTQSRPNVGRKVEGGVEGTSGWLEVERVMTTGVLGEAFGGV
jgi:hypothetical protein